MNFNRNFDSYSVMALEELTYFLYNEVKVWAFKPGTFRNQYEIIDPDKVHNFYNPRKVCVLKFCQVGQQEFRKAFLLSYHYATSFLSLNKSFKN